MTTHFTRLVSTVCLVAWAIVATTACATAAFAAEEPPKHLADQSQVRAWVEAHKGFGMPEYAEFTLIGRHVLVAWNCPFSGVSSNYAYAYRELADAKGWELVNASFFPQPEILSHAYFDSRSGKLVYVSVGGKELKSLAIGPRD